MISVYHRIIGNISSINNSVIQKSKSKNKYLKLFNHYVKDIVLNVN